MWVPIPFEKSFTMAYGRTHYGTGYYIYHKFLPDAPNLSRPIKSWNMDVPPADVLDLINRSGTDIAAGTADYVREIGSSTLPAAETTRSVRHQQHERPATIRALKLSVKRRPGQGPRRGVPADLLGRQRACLGRCAGEAASSAPARCSTARSGSIWSRRSR